MNSKQQSNGFIYPLLILDVVALLQYHIKVSWYKVDQIQHLIEHPYFMEWWITMSIVFHEMSTTNQVKQWIKLDIYWPMVLCQTRLQYETYISLDNRLEPPTGHKGIVMQSDSQLITPSICGFDTASFFLSCITLQEL